MTDQPDDSSGSRWEPPFSPDPARDGDAVTSTQAQSAQIDMVSGATVTSTGYLQSLQSALDKAGA